MATEINAEVSAVCARLFVALALLLSSAAHAIDIAGAPIRVGLRATPVEVTAARELQRYERLICGRQAPVVTRAPRGGGPAVAVGTPESLPDVAAYVPATLSEQGYVIRVAPEKQTLVLAARTPIGVQYAVYSLLEHLGVGFYLGGDALPERRESLVVEDTLRIEAEPALRIRGSLPWYNFLNSPTTWNLEDHRYFFDQMAKMKMNFVGFHSYDSEPFCAYPDEGGWQHGSPAATSENYGWGAVRGMKTVEFGFGTGRYFGQKAFGSRASVDMASPDDGIQRAQAVLAQGLQYAKERGIHPCIGFELVGDPTDPAVLRRYEKKIRYVLARYPMVDYVWFWQSEGLGGGAAHDLRTSQLGALVDRYKGAFEYLGSPDRVAEAVRVAAFAQFAHQVTRQVRPDVGIIVSGWGGDRWMRFSDFYVGLDSLLPSDIIFAALDNIDPSWETNVSHAYGKLSPTRQRWPIPWFSSDGGGARRDQWGPQCNTKPFTSLCRDALAKGSQGLLGIHWEVRGVEEVAAYVAQFAWKPDLTYEAFYDGFARRCYGDGLGPEMSAIHQKLESLGPRWTGGQGQVECGGFDWFSGPARPQQANLDALATIRRTVESFAQTTSPRHRERLRYLLATIDFLVSYDRAAMLLCAEGPVPKRIAEAEQLMAEGREREARVAAEDLWRLVQSSGLEEAMRAYPTRLTTQGDFGNLATINVKAYAAYENLCRRLEKMAPPPARTAPDEGPRLAMKTPAGVIPKGVPLEVRCAAFSEGYPAKVTLRYRAPGARFRELPMAQDDTGSFVAHVPGSAIRASGVEFCVQVRDSLGRTVTAPSTAPGTPFSCSVAPYQGPTVYPPVFLTETAFGCPPDGGPADVMAAVQTPMEFGRQAALLELSGGLTVVAEGQYGLLRVHLAAVSMPPAGRHLVARATDEQGRRGASAIRAVRPDVTSPTAADGLTLDTAEPYAVHLAWRPARDDVGVWRYEVHRSDAPGFAASEATLVGATPRCELTDRAAPVGHAACYAVVALDEAGHRGPPAYTQSAVIPTPPPLPAPTDVQAAPGPGRISIAWSAVPETAAVGYRVYEAVGGGWRALSEEPTTASRRIVAPLEPGARHRYRVVAVDPTGRDGLPSAEVAAAATAPHQEPVFEARFDTPRAQTGQQGVLHAPAKLDGGVLDTTEGGWIAYPNADDLQLAGPLSFEMWVCPTAVPQIPVLLAFGHWEQQGYFLQNIGGRVRYYLGRQQTLDAGGFELGRWQHVAAVFDGESQVLYVDGREVGRRAVPTFDLTPWPGELRIGQYAEIDAQFAAPALYDDVRIYQRPLTAQEVQAHFAAGRE